MTSRVAKSPIKIPSGVDVKISAQELIVKGKMGELKKAFPILVKVTQSDGHIQVTAANELQASDAQSGTIRAVIQNMVTGVSAGFTKKLVLVGVGYRAKVQGTSLDLTLGFSHPVVIP